MDIENFRGIRKIKVENLPNLVVIAGGNGVGKSSILDAIRLVKAQVRPYDNSESELTRDILQNAIRKGENYCKILLEIEPITDKEKELTQNKIAKLGSEFKDGRWHQIAENNPGGLFQTPKNEGENESILEYNPAQRIFSEGQRQLQLQQEDQRNFLGSRSGKNVQNKFGQLKDKIIRLAAYDRLVDNEKKYFPEIVLLIKQLLGREIEVKFNAEGRPPEIIVKNEQGELDVDSLSSGEREILMSYFSIHSLKMSNSIFLFDEPDLHLHASSQKAVLEYLSDMTKKGNQIIITSHAAELISTCPTESLFYLN